MPNRSRILIADDHLLIAEMCKCLLEPHFEVVAIVTDGEALVAKAAELKPDVAIIDISMPLLDGLHAGEQIKSLNQGVKIIYLTMHMDVSMAVEAFRHGASGYVVKTSTVNELVTAVRKALRGERFLSPSIDEDVVSYELRSDGYQPHDGGITRQQRKVLELLIKGMTLKQAADTLNIKMGTVAFHKYRMMERLGFTTNAELFRYAVKHRIMAGS